MGLCNEQKKYPDSWENSAEEVAIVRVWEDFVS